ncbi:hypothetical protein PV08_05900 [Exophiala spinifera]|uniref:Uncharacterized protein n=1 Tax=Exophiala spinifera TaxID=91928 RepID=A0A0D2BB60_9EURO|nr:uncharacterized protein PV08_05900 [Exophiala spinifera]KIW15850.1 hypothetical protein PV08_05900 [Exophiala spinifera]
MAPTVIGKRLASHWGWSSEEHPNSITWFLPQNTRVGVDQFYRFGITEAWKVNPSSDGKMRIILHYKDSIDGPSKPYERLTRTPSYPVPGTPEQFEIGFIYDSEIGERWSFKDILGRAWMTRVQSVPRPDEVDYVNDQVAEW